MRVLLASTLLLFLAACEQVDPVPAESSLPAHVEATFTGVDFAPSPEVAAMPMETRKAAIRASIQAASDIVSRANDWREADQIAQAAIANAASDLERSHIEQATAKLMLVSYLAPNAGETGTAERALAYADVLVEHESPEAEAILAASQAFANEWPQDDLRRIAIRSAESAETHVANAPSCDDCDLPAAAGEHMIETGQTEDIKSLRRLRAAEQLRTLAE